MGLSYEYLLGLYLGDGVISRHRRGVWALRISQDTKYPGLIEACKAAIAEVGARQPGVVRRIGCHEIYSTSKHWPCLFPQAGPGSKHLRRIELEAWQWRLVEDYPRELVKGLIHSDGCRVINRVRSGAGKRYEYPRYFFTSYSAEIRAIFVRACGLIGVECRPDGPRNLFVAKRQGVAILDEFIGGQALRSAACSGTESAPHAGVDSGAPPAGGATLSEGPREEVVVSDRMHDRYTMPCSRRPGAR